MGTGRFSYTNPGELGADIRSLDLDIPLGDDTAVLGTSVNIGGRTIPNRLAIHPMEGCDGTPEGRPGELTVRRYERFGGGGAGLVWFEACAVVHEGRANPRQLLMNEANAPFMSDLLQTTLVSARETCGRDFRPYTVLQLTHSGRFSRPDDGPRPLIAVNRPPIDDRLRGPWRVIGDDELAALVDRYAEAAVLARDMGFDAVDVKSCHGYLVSELLGARTRVGRYGGDFEGRTRFLLEIVDAIRRSAPDLAVTTRLNAWDGVPYPYGWGVSGESQDGPDLAEPLALARLLRDRGVRLLNVSAGIPYVNPHIGRPYDSGPYVSDEHQLKGIARMLGFARSFSEALPDVAFMATGFTWLREMGALCAAGGIDAGWFTLAGFGRQAFAYPEFARDVVSAGMQRDRCCVTCGACSDLMRLDSATGCVVRDADVYRPVHRAAVERSRRTEDVNHTDCIPPHAGREGA